MSMPQQHLVAYCSDLGISATVGATMLSVLLGMGFFSRQGWGWLSDRMGGAARPRCCSSIMQCAAMSGFLFTQDTVGLFTVSTAFGIGFSALIPAYVLTIRELYPLSEAHWRVPFAAAVQRQRHGAPAAGSPAISTTSTAITSRPSPPASPSTSSTSSSCVMLLVRQRTYAIETR